MGRGDEIRDRRREGESLGEEGCIQPHASERSEGSMGLTTEN